jgi:predicted peptidase
VRAGAAAGAVGVLTLGLALAVTPSRAARETGLLNRTVVVAGETRRYQVYVPADYTPSRRRPVTLFMHGAGERGDDGLLPTEIGIGTALRRHPDRYPTIVVFPQAPLDTRWPGASSRIALAALDRTLAEFRCDSDRVYLTGISMGGNGAWYLAYREPRRFAAILVCCGWVLPNAEHPTAEPVVPPADGPAIARLAARLRHVPVCMYHGAADDVIPPADSRAMAAAFDSLGAPARYTELPGVGHGCWDAAYQSAEVPAWLFDQRRFRGNQ